MKHQKQTKKNKVDVPKLAIIAVVVAFWCIVIINEEYVSECVFRHVVSAGRICGRH